MQKGPDQLGLCGDDRERRQVAGAGDCVEISAEDATSETLGISEFAEDEHEADGDF